MSQELKTKVRAEAEHFCAQADQQTASTLWIIESPEQLESGEWEIYFYVEQHHPRTSSPFLRTRERVIRRPCACGAPAEVIDLYGNDACHACADCAVQAESKRL